MTWVQVVTPFWFLLMDVSATITAIKNHGKPTTWALDLERAEAEDKKNQEVLERIPPNDSFNRSLEIINRKPSSELKDQWSSYKMGVMLVSLFQLFQIWLAYYVGVSFPALVGLAVVYSIGLAIVYYPQSIPEVKALRINAWVQVSMNVAELVILVWEIGRAHV